VEEFIVSVEPPAPTGEMSPVAGALTSCWMLELGAQGLAVLLLPHRTSCWAMLQSGLPALDARPSTGTDSLAERLEQEVAASLLAELCLVDRRQPASVCRTPADALADWAKAVRAWTIHARSSDDRAFSVLLAASRMEMLAPAVLPLVRAPLESRRAAVSENMVALRGVVGETSMSVTELADLAVDDVLLLDQSLTGQVALVAQRGGAAVALGNLGRAGAKRAIRVAGLPAQQGK
jgi:flagellar motor switch/type III secretory pathway protein FliN